MLAFGSPESRTSSLKVLEELKPLRFDRIDGAPLRPALA